MTISTAGGEGRYPGGCGQAVRVCWLAPLSANPKVPTGGSLRSVGSVSRRDYHRAYYHAKRKLTRIKQTYSPEQTEKRRAQRRAAYYANAARERANARARYWRNREKYAAASRERRKTQRSAQAQR